MQRTRWTAILATLTLMACASANTGRGGVDRNFLARDAITSVDVTTLYQVVQRLRPRWLTVRGSRSFNADTDIVVFQEQTLLGGVDILRRLSPDMATSLRYMDGAVASASLPGIGSRHVEAAIIIEPS